MQNSLNADRGRIPEACRTPPVFGRDWRQFTGDILLALLWVWFAARFLTAFLARHDPQDGLLLVLESFTAAAFLTRRRAKTASADVGDWVIALAATIAGLLFYPEPSPLPLPLRRGLEAVQALGSCASICGVLWLRRSFGIVPANRGVRVSGTYRWVRHPIYAGYIVTYAAYAAANLTVRNAAIFTAMAFFQVLRIESEENHLKRDPEYREYLARTRWRLFPFVY